MARKIDRTKAPQKPKETDNTKSTKGDQLDLIDVAPENSKEIIRQARIYKKAQAERIEVLAQEVDSKQKLLALIKEANLKPLEDGVIRFRLDGFTITVKPRDELIKVKEDADSDD